MNETLSLAERLRRMAYEEPRLFDIADEVAALEGRMKRLEELPGELREKAAVTLAVRGHTGRDAATAFDLAAESAEQALANEPKDRENETDGPYGCMDPRD